MHIIYSPISILLNILTAAFNIDDGTISDANDDFGTGNPKRTVASIASESPVVFQGISSDLQSLYRIYQIALPAETPLEHIRLWVQEATSKREIQHCLPVARGLLRYLAEPPQTGYLNCISFIERILDIGAPLIEGLQRQGWRWAEDLAEEQILLGDIVLLFPRDDHTHPRHIAVKFAENLYLSKAHPDFAPIMLADLELMKSVWKADHTLVVGSRSLP
jgi:hypothetical protein